ncbi:MAG: hypothetical protein IIC24_10050, partial [Chloroflexi bacterium]|nr:hypothetical protein [Chloroflexota bacterium]
FEVPLGSLWYPVYGYDRTTGECLGGLGSAAWNDGGPPVLVTPWLGFYCFGDPGYREQTIELMREYDLSWTLISWNGWGDIDFDGTIEARDFQAAHKDIVSTFEYIAGPLEGRFKAALLVEPYMDLGELNPGNLTGEQKTLVLDRIWEDIYLPNQDAVFMWKDKPLLVQWFPLDLGEDDRFTIRTFGSSADPQEPLLDWNWYPDPALYPEIISDDGFVSFAPRFDEYFMSLFEKGIENPRRMDPFLEEHVYEEFWRIVTENKDQVRLILIYAWNGYGEQAFIEPAVNGPLGSGGPDGRMLLEKTRDLYREFKER